MNNLNFVNILDVNDDLKFKVRLWRNRKDIRDCMIDSHIITEEEHLQWLSGLKNNDKQKFWVVFFDETPIGSVYLHDINKQDLSSSWGFYIGEESYRRKGLGKKMLFMLLQEFFENMHLKTLKTTVYSNNSTALAIYKKFYFTEVEVDQPDNSMNLTELVFTISDWTGHKESLFNDYFYS